MINVIWLSGPNVPTYSFRALVSSASCNFPNWMAQGVHILFWDHCNQTLPDVFVVKLLGSSAIALIPEMSDVADKRIRYEGTFITDSFRNSRNRLYSVKELAEFRIWLHIPWKKVTLNVMRTFSSLGCSTKLAAAMDVAISASSQQRGT